MSLNLTMIECNEAQDYWTIPFVWLQATHSCRRDDQTATIMKRQSFVSLRSGLGCLGFGLFWMIWISFE